MSLLKKSTLQLLRFHFSYFLMPVYWFTLSFVPQVNVSKAILAFLLIHFLLYPASNGYNSFMDKDTTSIGGIKNPLQPEKELFLITLIMDLLGILLSFFISPLFAACFLFYIICSRLYSSRAIRLKRFPVIGYLTVILNQGSLIFFMIYHAANVYSGTNAPLPGLLAASFLIGGFYPITQVYQHREDAADGVTTISMLLGKRNTFIFCAFMYIISFTLLLFYYRQQNKIQSFFIIQIFFVPVIIYFIKWLMQVWKNESAANFKNTMRMNWLASTCTNLAFLTLIIFNKSG